MCARRFPIGLAAIVPLVIACAVYVITAGSTVANPDATPTGSPESTPTPFAPYVTGIPELDALIYVAEYGDARQLESLVRLREIDCFNGQAPNPLPPRCPDGVEEGTAVRSFLGGICEMQFRSADYLPVLLNQLPFGRVDSAVNMVLGENDLFGRPAEYSIVVLLGADESWPLVLNVVDGEVDGLVVWCDRLANVRANADASGVEVDFALGSAPSPEPPPAQIAEHGPFHDSAWVRVNAGAGDCLNARSGPSLSAEYALPNVCLPDGFEGMLTGSAIEADGHWWWYMAGMGWVAEEYLAYLRGADLPNAAALLPDGARVALVRDDDVWLLDGRGERMLYDTAVEAPPQALGWSPDGEFVSFIVTRYGIDKTEQTLQVVDRQGSLRLTVDGASMYRWSPDGTRIAYSLLGEPDPQTYQRPAETRVVDLTGTELLRVEGAGVGEWSPDGGLLSIVQGTWIDGMGASWHGVPGYVEVATGAIKLFAEAPGYQDFPPRFSADGSLIIHRRAGREGTPAPIVLRDLEGTDLITVEQREDAYVSSPYWSPIDNRVAMHVSQGDTPHYAVFDATAGQVVVEAAVPKANPNLGGSCGSVDMWRMAWSDDGRRIAYSYDLGLTGTNGVWIWDLDSGEQRIIPAINASGAEWVSDDTIAFTTYGPSTYIFLGSAAGGYPVLLAEGLNAAWWHAR